MRHLPILTTENIITSIVLVLVAGISLYIFLQNRDMGIETDQHLQKQTNMEFEFKKMNEELNEKLSKTPIKDTTCEDDKGGSLLLSDLVSQKPALIFRFSELNCYSCYETELALLRAYFSGGEGNTAILCSYQQRRYFIAFKNQNDIQFPMFRISQDAFDWEIEEYGVPYYFVLHPDLRVSHIHILNNDFPELNKQYIDSVKRFLSK